ncbi:MAG: pilus assembly protein [Pseudolabrys sp.]|nr:pilus assembly protein [Pseudolabrys sp.]
MRAVWNKFAHHFAAFKGANRGNVAITFAIATLPLVGTVGMAVDYSHANAVKTAMQAALDSTALMLSKDAATISNAALQTKAKSYFDAVFLKPEATNVVITAAYSTTGGSQVKVDGSALVPTSFLGVIGFQNLTINGTSTTAWGSTRLRIALVHDTTGSMDADGKIDALKTSTKNLLTQLKSAASNPGDIYVSIVPFSRGVNIGANNYNAAYIDWTEWEAPPPYMATWLANASNKSTWDQTGPGDACPFSSNKTGFGCTTGPASTAPATNNIPSSGTYSGYICPGVDTGSKDSTEAGFYYNGCYTSTTFRATGSSATCTGRSNCSCSGSGSSKVCKTNDGYFEHTWVKNARSTWTGCVADRGAMAAPGTTAGPDQTAATPTTSDVKTLYPARQDSYCPKAVMGLNYNWTSMAAAVDALDTNGGTNQTIGLALGWHSLVGIGPFTAPPKDSNYEYTDVVILMSDGLNTWNRWYGNGSATNTSVDYRMYDSSGRGTCANIKNSGVTLYTIQVNTGGDATSTLLQNCAGGPDKFSDPSKFYMVDTASGLGAVFTAIGTNLTKLRVAK